MADTTSKKEKQKGIKIISPIFTAKYAWLNKPNQWGRYSVTGLFDAKVPENRAMLAQLKGEYEKSIAAAKAQFKPSKKQKELETVQPYEQDDETGFYKINFGNKAEIEWKNPKTGEKETFSGKPALFDSKGQPTDVEPWAGSKLRVCVEVFPFFSGNKQAGLSLRLKQVQVIDLVTRGAGGSVSEFDAVAGGFSADSFGGEAGDDDFTNDGGPGMEAGDDAAPDDETQAASTDTDDFDF